MHTTFQQFSQGWYGSCSCRSYGRATGLGPRSFFYQAFRGFLSWQFHSTDQVLSMGCRGAATCDAGGATDWCWSTGATCSVSGDFWQTTNRCGCGTRRWFCSDPPMAILFGLYRGWWPRFHRNGWLLVTWGMGGMNGMIMGPHSTHPTHV